MDRIAILDTLKKAAPALRSKGVAHAALFGSFARLDEQPGSDIDIMVEIASDADLDMFGYIEIVHAIEDLFSVPVDVSNKLMMKAHVRPSAERDAVYAF